MGETISSGDSGSSGSDRSELGDPETVTPPETLAARLASMGLSGHIKVFPPGFIRHKASDRNRSAIVLEERWREEQNLFAQNSLTPDTSPSDPRLPEQVVLQQLEQSESDPTG